MESVQAAARGAPPVRICLIWTIAQYRHPVLHLAAGRHATDLVMSLAGRDLTIGYSDRMVGRGLNVALERGEGVVVAVGTCVSSHAPRTDRTCGFPAYGSPLGCMTAKVAVYAPARLSREPGSGSSTCCADAYSPWPPPFAPPTPLRSPPQTPPQWASFALFAGFIATMTRSDFSGPCIIGFGSSPSRCGPPYTHGTRRRRPDTRSPRFRCDPFARDVALDPGRASAPRITVPHMLPSSE